ncbi:MAG: hypothetical protein V4679_20695 [Pseudomonadota bacterium]
MVQKQQSQRRSLLAAMSLWAMAGACGAQASPAGAERASSKKAPGKAGRAGIHPWIDPGDTVVADVLVDGKRVARLDHRARVDGMTRTPALVFPLPVGVKRVQLRGTATLKGQSGKFDTTWKVRDLAPISGPLYDQSRPWIERVRGLASKMWFVTVKPWDADVRQRPAGPVFADLEKRLGAPLPPLVKVLGDWRITVQDSAFQSAAEMGRATDLLLGKWHYRESGAKGLGKILPRAVRARYDRSLTVFNEVGDGLGALAWDPVGVVAGEPTHVGIDRGDTGARPGPAGEGVWFWLHQNHIDEPILLLDEDYRPRNAESALTHVFQRFALSDDALPEKDDELVVDTANPRANLLQLTFTGPTMPSLELRGYDYHYSLY